MKDWACGSAGKWVSMAVPAVGDYGMGTGFFYSVPVICGPPGHFRRVGGVSLSHLNDLEVLACELLEFRVSVSAEELQLTRTTLLTM